MSNLDDFFAKKDRKKKSQKGFSKANTDVIAKNLEENERKEQKAEKESAVCFATTEANRAGASEDVEKDEWKEYDEDKRDYSNLKIESLRVEESDEAEEEAEHEINEEGEKVKVKKHDGGPWNKLVAPADGSDEDSPAKSTSEPAPSEAHADDSNHVALSKSGAVVNGAYVPPHLRAGGGGGGGGVGVVVATRGGPKRTKQAPDMNSHIFFPSLSDSMNAPRDYVVSENDKGRNSFVEVKGGHHQARSTTEAPSSVSVDNKFSALRSWRK